MNNLYPFFASAALFISLFVWLRSDIKHLRDDLKERLDKQEERLSDLSTQVAALKATIETFFRVRIDPPPSPEKHDQAA